jgi:hypothetical protein
MVSSSGSWWGDFQSLQFHVASLPPVGRGGEGMKRVTLLLADLEL